jgi:hypothetical protein
LSKLPSNFGRKHQFVKTIDSLRHEFGGHLTSSSHYMQRGDQLSRPDLLFYLTGSKIEPNSLELVKIQIKILELFIDYLDNLYSYIKTNHVSKW